MKSISIILLAIIFLTMFFINGPTTKITANIEVSSPAAQPLVTSSDRVSAENFANGGIAKDGIPAINEPKFVALQDSQFKADDLIIGVTHNGISKAYPYGILNWHEIVNDVIGDLPIAVTMCPLCDTGLVFVRTIDDKQVNFGVSEKLFQSCLVMYDQLTGSLWSQPWGLGISGEKNNAVLQQIPAIKTTLGKWQAAYPDTVVLSTNTGYNRDYYTYPYGQYNVDNSLMFPVRNTDQLTTHSKDIISYVYEHNNQHPQNNFSGQAYKITHLDAKQLHAQQFSFGNKTFRAVWDDKLDTVRVYDTANGHEIPTSTAFSFVYPAFFEVNEPK